MGRKSDRPPKAGTGSTDCWVLLGYVDFGDHARDEWRNLGTFAAPSEADDHASLLANASGVHCIVRVAWSVFFGVLDIKVQWSSTWWDSAFGPVAELDASIRKALLCAVEIWLEHITNGRRLGISEFAAQALQWAVYWERWAG